ncbi:MAG TPA: beta-galactosidase [Polyangiaceae bacterium]|nr:beta-galactosidase [Polyangiaceae bacterium]
MSGARVRLVPEGLELSGGERLPLYAGSVHYWRLSVEDWRACLRAVREVGFRLVDVYVPWAVHERAPGSFDFGEHDARLDLVRFLKLAHELGLYAIVRPGPHINAELTYFGIPARVIWDPACQARSPRGSPVMLPMVPVAFPVPSYASEVFHREAERYFAALGPLLAPLRHPEGPVVMVQVDNEGALYFRDSAYDQDYHPDAVAQYRQFVAAKYGSEAAAAAAYGLGAGAVAANAGAATANGPGAGAAAANAGAAAANAGAAANGPGAGATATNGPGAGAATNGPGATEAGALEPPKRFDATDAAGLLRHLDWVEFHEELLAASMGRMRAALEASGVTGLPTSHNLPFGQETTPLNAARLGRVVDLVALDYYHKASPLDRKVIARRTTELVARCEGRGHPPFAAEMGAGFPPFFPPLVEDDSAFTLLAALAYGLRGFNAYMAVERDRWLGAPIDRRGKKRPFARFYEKLLAALDEVDFPRLRRRAPVRLVTPRSLRRLTRAMHAFGPATGAFFAVLGAGARERCFEDDLGLGGPVALEGDAFVRAFEGALEARGVPFAHVAGEDYEVALGGARWVVCATTGGLKPAFLERLDALAAEGAWVTLGPRPPERDGSMRPLSPPPDLGRMRLLKGERGAFGPSRATVDREVARAIEALGLPTYACAPTGVHATAFEDSSGALRAAFVLNPGPEDVVARVALPGVVGARDLLEGSSYEAAEGLLEVRMPPRRARFFRLQAGGAA